jgi:tRNA A-37 threonylcarbamoyl transferase component Bud32
MAQDDAYIGRVLEGKYRIDTFIQKGGMGSVYAGTHLNLGRKVAIKTFHRELTEERSFVVRFLNEAKGTSRINHRNIVDIIDIGMDEEGYPFFVMEFLEGESLKSMLHRAGGRLPLHETADLMIQVLFGLNAAHQAGIVHRDMKPGNIFIAREPDGAETVKVLDFGIARFLDFELEGRGMRTETGSLLGTPEYMSLEQARGERELIDHRTDIYACGVILYQCLTGVQPMRGASHIQTLQNIASKAVPPPSSLVDTISPEVDEVVMMAMEREREKRFQDCKSFIEAMDVFYVMAPTLQASREAFLASGGKDIFRRTGRSPKQPKGAPAAAAAPPKAEAATKAETAPQSIPAASGRYAWSRKEILAEAERSRPSRSRGWIVIVILLLVALAGAAAALIYYSTRSRSEGDGPVREGVAPVKGMDENRPAVEEPVEEAPAKKAAAKKKTAPVPSAGEPKASGAAETVQGGEQKEAGGAAGDAGHQGGKPPKGKPKGYEKEKHGKGKAHKNH